MSDQAEARRFRLLELMADQDSSLELEALASSMKCDVRTIRRDLDHLQQILGKLHGLDVRRGKVFASRAGYSPGYFSDQLGRNAAAKLRIARAVVASLADESAIALTAGSTPYAVSCELRRSVHEEGIPRNLIVFTNSVPALLELVSADIATGVLGEIYSAEDCAFHSPEFRSAFQPGVAIVGASGVLLGGSGDGPGIDLYSHRAEEAAFLKQVLARVPEIVVAADSTKLGRRHPWSFGGSVLCGKRVRLVTDTITAELADTLTALTARAANDGVDFSFEAAGVLANSE